MNLKDTTRWNRLRLLFDRAAEFEDPARADAYLKAECAGDDELLGEAARLLALHREEHLAVDSSPVESLGSLLGGRVWEAGQLLAGGRFRIIRFLGEGGIGEVFEAEDLELKQHLAIKTLHPLRASEESTRERFKRELQLARRISHPNICRIFDFFPGEVSFITMELLEGEVLSERIARDGPLKPDAALPIVRELCAGLDAAHAQKIVHRDLKPSNIMLCEGRAVIMDFGLALLDERHDDTGATQPTSALGTPAYMSPEQLEGRRITTASDIYSFGMVLYAMLTGTVPHAGLSPLAIAARRVQEPPPSPRAVQPAVPERWDQAVRQCLQVNPAKRFRNASDVVEAIEGRAHWRVPRKFVGIAALLVAAGWMVWRGGLLAHQPNAAATRWLQMGDDAMSFESSSAAAKLYARSAAADPQFALAKIRLAEAEIEQDRYELAKNHLLEADLVASHAPSEVATELQAVKAASVRDFATAAKLYQALPRTVFTLLARSAIQARSGDRKAALSTADEAVRMDPRSAAAWLRKGVLEDQGGAESLRRAEEIFDLQGNKEGLIEVYRNRALMTGRLPAEATAELDKALAVARGIASPAAQAQVLFALSRISRLKGDGDQAIAQATEARRVASAAQLDELSIRGTLDLAQAKSSQYKMVEMEPMLREAARQAESIRAFYLLAQVRFTLAKALSVRPVPPEEIAGLLQQAEDFFRANHLDTELNATLSWAVLLDTAAGRYDLARRRAQEVVDRSHDAVVTLVAEENLAEIEDRTGAFDASLKRYLRLADAYEQRGLKQKAVYALSNGASAAVRWGALDEAHRRLAKAGEILSAMNQPKSSARMFFQLVQAELALAERRYPDAEREARAVLEGNKGGAVLRDVLANGIIAVCRAAAGLALADSNLAAARADEQQFVLGQAWLRKLETLMAAGRFDQAARVADELIPWLAARQHRGEQIEAMALRAAALRSPLPEFPQVWAQPELIRFLARPDIQQFMKGRITQ